MALLGWSPRGERAEQEFFTMSELAEAFDIAGISKSPAIFDIEKLTYFNANYIRNMASEDFAKAAEPFIRQSVKNEAYSASEIAALLQARCEKLTDIPEKVDFFDALPDYDLAFYTNKKSKTDAAVSLEMLQKVPPKARGAERLVHRRHPRYAHRVRGGAGREERHAHVAPAHRLRR